MNKKQAKLLASAILLVGVLWGAWSSWFSTTRIGFLNYQVINLGQISKANTNSFISLEEVLPEDLAHLSKYDMLLINGMGLHVTAEERALIQKAADNGLPVLTTAATNPANKIVSLDSIQADSLARFLGNGGRRNYRSMLNYVRKDVDGKLFSTEEPGTLLPRANDLMYHAQINSDEEDLGFNSVALYQDFLKKENLWKEGAPSIVITGQMGEPTELITALEKSGNVVYPVRDMKTFIDEQHIDSVAPSAVINMAHGRMGDYMVDYLTEQNIPLFCPLNVNRLVSEWENDKMGMNGGFLSQSVVTPEIDGAIRPYALFGHYLDEEGLQHAFAMPERLEVFVQTINNYIRLKQMDNSQKRVAIYYYKGAGQSALTAAGMEVVPSLYNLLLRLKKEGYTVKNLPASSQELGKMIQQEGAIFGTYAEGAASNFMKTAHPQTVDQPTYEAWIEASIRPEKYQEVVAAHGEFPGQYMVNEQNELTIARLDFGNIVLLPQPAAGSGSDTFQMVHGTDAAPPHTYLASYLWVQHGFKADAMIHFGTHGSLEFTPKKQVALSHNDWPDRLVGALPHFYVYSIGNVGEGMMAKRRSYAGLQSYLTPPFMESSVRGIYRELSQAIQIYNNQLGEGKNQQELDKRSLKVKALTVKMGIHRELGLDSLLNKPYTEDEVARVENFAEELATEKITGQLYTMGVPYSDDRIVSSVYAMATEPIAYSLLALDKMRNKVDAEKASHKTYFTRTYLKPSRELVTCLLKNPALGTDELICKTAGVSMDELTKARKIEKEKNAPKGMMAMMMAMADAKKMEKAAKAMGMDQKTMDQMKSGKMDMSAMKEMAKKLSPAMLKKIREMHQSKKIKMDGASSHPSKEEMMAKAHGDSAQMKAPHGGHPMGEKAPVMDGKKAGRGAMMGMSQMMAMMNKKPQYTKEEVNLALAIVEVERTIKNVGNYRKALLESPEAELGSMMNGLRGGYVQPSPGGDPIANPNTLPTGRNMFAINAEATPSESAWDKGVLLAKNTIKMYQQRHHDSIPRKVSYTLWSGEFIETEGATIAQVLYMLGVEPVRDVFGRVNDIRLIPSKELGRPRIDVVVQTSGQLRDLAASRLFLINRAVEMAAAAQDDAYENQVAASVVEAERVLVEKGLSPKEAREISSFRVFGGMNGNYGTGIQGMVQSGDRWESEDEIANVYLNNMGAFYGDEKNWENVRQFAFEAALTHTDAVIQPRQSNTWGALSLDHVYEFMGGLNLAVRNVTGKDPDAYLSDYRNRNNVRMQEVKEAIGVESRTTLFNPAYIKEKMKGEATSASTFAELIQNTYGWNVMKPDAIDTEMWDEIYNVYVKDKFDLGVQKYFEDVNPAALQDMTAVMMETARKGMWKASEQQLKDVAELHTDLINKYKPACTGAVCDNAKLQQFIASQTSAEKAKEYKKSISSIREATLQNNDKGVVMKKQQMNKESDEQVNSVSNLAVIVLVAVVFIVLLVLIRKRRKNMQE